jgi:PAS domain S-box-containing protein
MKNLQNETQKAVRSTIHQDKSDALCKAFELFSYNPHRLEKAYDILNEQFYLLNQELQDTNHELRNKVAELDILAGYLNNIVDNIIQGILFIDLNGFMITCNRSAENMLGISRQTFLLKRFWDVFSDDLFGFSMKQALQEQQKKSAVYSTTYNSPTHQTSELEVITTFALKNSEKSPSESQGMIIMMRDVTEIKQLQLEAARTDRMKVLGEMAAHVAHEIRNPLGGIKGFASLLKTDLADRPDLQKMASSIVDGTDSLNHLVTQILQYTRPIQPHFEPIDLSGLLREIRDHVLADANIVTSSLEFAIDAPSEPLLVPLDSRYFKSAILNLVVNAIQAMPSGGKLLFSVRKQQNNAILSVSDTGLGIPNDHLPKLFSPFFTTKPDGNGLGLVEVQKVIQAHSGTIDVYSKINQGTTFTIKLPLVKSNSSNNEDIHGNPKNLNC